MYWESEKDKFTYYKGSYKKNLISKEQKVDLYLYKDHIEGTGFKIVKEDEYETYCDFQYNFVDILDIELIEFHSQQAIRITVNPSSAIFGDKKDIYIYLPKLENCIEISDKLKSVFSEYLEGLNEKQRLESIAKFEEAEKERIRHQEQQSFYKNCFDFHINNNRPVYILKQEDLQCAAIYIDENKFLNFLIIDGIELKETNCKIEYNQLHYYEKAGTIHYTTDINGNYSSFGGSFTGPTFSKKVTFWAGLMLGPMGMLGGALFTHKPAEYTAPYTNLEIKSQANKIDDRSVILNYYSELHKQLIDIELPADIYNFLQTYLPEKKYDLVLEVEKHRSVNSSITNSEQLSLSTNEVKAELQEQTADSLTLFQQKIIKLKLLKENGILTESEFQEEKQKLLSEL